MTSVRDLDRQESGVHSNIQDGNKMALACILGPSDQPEKNVQLLLSYFITADHWRTQVVALLRLPNRPAGDDVSHICLLIMFFEQFFLKKMTNEIKF